MAGRGRRWGAPTRVVGSLAGAAAVLAGVTLLARVAGFGRVGVLSQTVGVTCLGEVYQSANLLPNIVFEVVAGGALASLVVPLLAGALDRGDREQASRTASALLTWTMLALLPVTLAGLVLVRPVLGLVLDADAACPGALDAGSRMLVYFLPQIPLYGVAIVLGGVLNAERRFVLPAVAPLLSSVVVAGAYLLFAAVVPAGARSDLTSLDLRSELALAGGTTLGVLVMALTLVPAVRASGIALRPSLRFPPGVARQARALAAAGVATLVAQQLSVAVVLYLANHSGTTGAIVIWYFAWTLFLLPWAVLVVPIATSAFPRLSVAAGSGDTAGFARTSAGTTVAVVMAGALGAAGLSAVAFPVARWFSAGPGEGSPQDLALALVALAPGLIGYALVAHVGRALIAAGRGRASAGAVVTGWVVVVVADLVLVAVLPPTRIVTALALGHSVGFVVAGALLLHGLRRVGGTEALAGLARSGAVAVAAAALAGAAGARVAVRVAGDAPSSTLVASAAVSVLAGVVAVLLFGAVVAVADRRTLLDTVDRLRRRTPTDA